LTRFAALTLIAGKISSKNAQSLLSDGRESGGMGTQGRGGRWVMKIEMNERVAPMEMITKTT
jgi:hypothetical protein